MTASLVARRVSLSFGATPLLDDVELTADPGQRIGLVGPNGVGKSTLLRILAGLQRPDTGDVRLTPSTATIGYLAQEPERLHETVAEFLHRRTGVAAADAALSATTHAMAGGLVGANEEYAEALDRWLALGAADFEARIGTVWADLGLAPRLLDSSMTALSGGEAARVGLAALLLSRFDVFLLDEPTNDLDLDGLDRLERFVAGLDAPCVIVSHDREFLTRTVTDVVELDEFTHSATWYSGGWSAYLRERELARLHAREAFEEYDTARSALLARAQREREWATQGLSRARKQPADNDKNIRAFKINQTEQLAGRAARTERAIERLDVAEDPRQPWQLRLHIPRGERSGEVVGRLDSVSVQRGTFCLGPLSVQINAGERVVIEGPNGSGKSTLIALLRGEVAPDDGSVWSGPGVVWGQLEQARRQLGSGVVLRSFQDATGMTISEARTLLAKFGIGAAHVDRPVDSLSPGERTRLVLALLMANGANVLVLDEPTNHLDLPAIEQLEQALDTFDGTVLLVSHDRQFLANVRRTRTLRLAHGTLVADEPA